MTHRLARSVHRLFADRRGNTVVVFSIMAGALVFAGGAAVDIASITQKRAQLQAIADGGALAGAKEFRLGNADVSVVGQVAANYANQALGSAGAKATVTPSVDDAAKTVTLALASDVDTFVLGMSGVSTRVEVSATAKVVGGAPICVIGLQANANSTVLLDKSSRLQAPNCSIYSNSTSPNGLMAKNKAVIQAAFICSSGGKWSPGPGSFNPDPQLDCPVLADPLSARAQPTAPGCVQTNLVISGGTTSLNPGSYCGGLTVTAGATVTLNSGVYIFKDGPLLVDGGATLNGANVGLFFSGKGAVLDFEAASTISLTAPKSGDMAGMLVFEDRSSPSGQVHTIYSDNARMLLGTIYLPVNRLHVAANKPVADQSAYTIVVANQFTLSEGPTMVLNTNYDQTNIPVPTGIGPNGNRTALTK
ncbi:MAG: pilus assembly protein [Hyphomicrobiales bacterium]|nr:pilus assembly protein [Hyphomicrobiales bacterium]